MFSEFRRNKVTAYKDYENYGNYKKMLQIISQKSIDISNASFENIDPSIARSLEVDFISLGIPQRQIAKFLHTI